MSDEEKQDSIFPLIGLLLGPLLAVGCFFLLPLQFTDSSTQIVEFDFAGRSTLAVMVWMGVWWLSEAVHVTVTALLPLVLFPLTGAASMQSAAAPYADKLVFLFIGGFLLAISMEYWGLGRRIALLTLRVMGTGTSSMIAGFMLVTAGLSAFISNTATTAMMLPIAMSVIELVRRNASGSKAVKADSAESEIPEIDPSQQQPATADVDPARQNQVNSFATCLMLAIAYAASIGGVATIIGTPTNLTLVGFLRDKIDPEYRVDVTFVSWLPIGISITALMLPTCFLLLTRVVFPVKLDCIPGGRQVIGAELRRLGPTKPAEWITLAVFLLTVLLWTIRPLLNDVHFGSGDSQFRPLAGLTDTGIVMGTALLLFLIPVKLKPRRFVMHWDQAKRLPWGILLLFGGGLSLAEAIKENQVSEFIGSLTSRFNGAPSIVIVLLVTAAIVFLTELTSNVATTASLVPVLAAMAIGLGVHPYLLVFPATVAASCAFMLPVATPPNAIVFGSGAVTIPQMVRAGFWLNLVSILLITLLTFLVIKPYLGI
jgi:sodium-dependent dicarboxylate transporter 2/3/5